ncbi:TPA: hypothetical protein SMI27_005012 [Serratia liquefaciens]|nr:hypothetical protein [Serratia liquefaciens]
MIAGVCHDTGGRAYRIAFGRRKGVFSDAGAWYQIDAKGKVRPLRTTDMGSYTLS